MTNTVLVKYKYVCSNGDSVIEWREEDDGIPSQCKENSSHTIVATSIRAIGRRDPTEQKIVEESTPTGGNFDTTSIEITAAASTTTSKTVSWPHPISALCVTFVSEETHRGDTMDLRIGEDTTIGTLQSDAGAASAWSSQNYTVGQTVTYDTGDATYGTRVYTCILNTVSNEVPTNTTYWQHGLRLHVASSVIAYTEIGYYLKLSDGTNTDNVGKVIALDSTNNYVYVETNLVNSFATATPTVILQTVYMFNDYKIGPPWKYTIGKSKIGGSYMPKDTKITVYYTNNTASSKTFIGHVELLY